MNIPTPIRRGFTLIELLVSVAILVVVILGVAILFRSTSSAVGMSQASMEMLANVRAFEQQFDRDIQHLDHNGFMIIRQNRPNAAGFFDQISFTATGAFQHKTGTTNTGTTSTTVLLDDGFTANAALIWYGHLVFAPANGQVSQGVSAYSSTTSSDSFLATAPPAAGASPVFNSVSGAAVAPVVLWQSYTLGRNAFLLAPNNGNGAVGPVAFPCAAYKCAALSDPTNITPTVVANSATDGTSIMPHITSGRIDAIMETPSQLMLEFWAHQATAVSDYCYRFKSLRNVNDDSLSIANSAFRMHTQILQGCTHFEVAWTDGIPNGSGAGSPARGQCVWYGTGWTGGFEPAPQAGDSYDAVFPVAAGGTYAHGTFPSGFWPKALRITLWVTDSSDRLKGGREFIMYVHLPN